VIQRGGTDGDGADPHSAAALRPAGAGTGPLSLSDATQGDLEECQICVLLRTMTAARDPGEADHDPREAGAAALVVPRL
jgi:hypothetical protein